MFFKLKDTKTPVTLEAKDPNHGNDEKWVLKNLKLKKIKNIDMETYEHNLGGYLMSKN